MKVEAVHLTSLVLDPANARKHSGKNLEAIKGSLAKFGQQKPIVVGKGNVVIAGNGTLEAARSLGWDKINVVRTELEGPEAIAFALADNRTSELAEWDSDVLARTLEGLQAMEFDLGAIGFDEAFLASVMPEKVAEGLTDPDAVPEDVETRCKPGDLWVLGGHRLLCGDSTNVQHVERLMGGEKAGCLVSDPPYGISFCHGGNDTSGIGKGRYKTKFAGKKIAGDDEPFDPRPLLAMFDKAILWGGNHFADKLPAMPSWLVWDKRAASEHTNDFADCEIAWTNLGGVARVFRHQWDGMIKASERGEARVHPTQKPIALMAWCIEKTEGLIADLFLGSGSTLIACHKTNRRCFAMEVDPHYVDVAIRRWMDYSGEEAYLEGPDGSKTAYSEVVPQVGSELLEQSSKARHK